MKPIGKNFPYNIFWYAGFLLAFIGGGIVFAPILGTILYGVGYKRRGLFIWATFIGGIIQTFILTEDAPGLIPIVQIVLTLGIYLLYVRGK